MEDHPDAAATKEGSDGLGDLCENEGGCTEAKGEHKVLVQLPLPKKAQILTESRVNGDMEIDSRF